MIALSVTLLVLASDQAVKFLLRRIVGPDPLSLGPLGSVRLVSGQLWMQRLRGQSSHTLIWLLWVRPPVR